MTVGERIKEQRIRHELSQEDVAKAIDTTKQAIYKYESGIVTNIPMDKIERLAHIFCVSPAFLMGWEETEDMSLRLPATARPVKRKRLPMLGNVACGEPIYATEEHDSFIDADEDVDADFCLTAKGDSMINARIFDGDILFVKSQQTVDNGEIAVVLIDDEATVKRVYYDKEANTITLMPENPTHKAMRYSGSEINNVRIIGKVIVGQYEVE